MQMKPIQAKPKEMAYIAAAQEWYQLPLKQFLYAQSAVIGITAVLDKIGQVAKMVNAWSYKPINKSLRDCKPKWDTGSSPVLTTKVVRLHKPI